jgi:uncharacterized protein (DUF1778 family)
MSRCQLNGGEAGDVIPNRGEAAVRNLLFAEATTPSPSDVRDARPALPWKSGASAPRKPSKINPGFSPRKSASNPKSIRLFRPGNLPYNGAMPVRQARIEARITPRQKRLFERAAAIEGVTLTDFAISSMQRAATRALQEHTTIALSERSQRAFVEALMNPPEPNAALRAAARAYAKMK